MQSSIKKLIVPLLASAAALVMATQMAQAQQKKTIALVTNAAADFWTIAGRGLEKAQKERPFGYLVREAPADDIRQLAQLAGHLDAGSFITKFRKIFLRSEMNDDLEMVPARYNEAEDSSEYEELLPVSPP